MKLSFKAGLLCFLLAFTFLFCPNCYAKADSSFILIGNYNVDGEILESGDMKVTEDVNFNFNGNFNGVTKEILYPENTSIESIKVTEDGKTFSKASSPSKGDNGVFKIESTNENSIMMWIYEPSSNTARNFKISYTIKNAVRKYNDTAELYWKFIGTENKTPIENVSINITLPEGSKEEDIKIWGHGPLTGNSSIVDDKTVNLSISNLPAERYIEARLLFPIKLVPGSKKVYKEDAVDRILSEEASLAEDANKQREEARNEVQDNNSYDYPQIIPEERYSSPFSGLGFILILLALALGIYVKTKYGKDSKPDFDGKYYRELPGDYPPAVMSVLYYRNVSCKDITATLMNLVRKRYLKLEIKQREKKGFFKTKIQKDYVITRLSSDDYSLLPNESFLMDWLLNDLGDGRSLSFNEIEEATSSRSDALRFKDKYNQWISMVMEDSEAYNFFEKGKNKGTLISAVFAVVLLIFVPILFKLGSNIITLALVIIASIFLFATCISLEHRTSYGSNQYSRWKAFKNFLEDFSNLKDAQPLSLILWEHYLVYAISLNIAKKVMNQLKILIPEEDLYYNTYQNNMLTFLYISQLNDHNMNIFDEFNNITSSFTELTDSAMAVANSSDSSSSGSGGGFSGGGGGSFGGGGDGGGGFGGF